MFWQWICFSLKNNVAECITKFWTLMCSWVGVAVKGRCRLFSVQLVSGLGGNAVINAAKRQTDVARSDVIRRQVTTSLACKHPLASYVKVIAMSGEKSPSNDVDINSTRLEEEGLRAALSSLDSQSK